MNRVNFPKPTGHFLGRNGFFKAVGVDLCTTADNKHVIMSPITSKDKIGRCEIWVPVEAVEDLISELYYALPEGTQQYFPITSVHRNDLVEKFGYAAHNISDESMRDLACDMADTYCSDLFWDSLEFLTEKYLEGNENVNRNDTVEVD